MTDLEAFAKLVTAVDLWRAHLIFIGGWAHRLHRLDPRANPLEHQPVFTRDTDLAFANKAPIEGDIKKALVNQGFMEDLSGEHKPPAAHYTLGREEDGFYAEFLTPLVGSGTKRDGTKDATMSKAGISAQKIRHLDILLVDPWTIKLDPQHGIPLAEPKDILVVNPLCFMVQKFLIQKDRTPAKRAQDILYVFDTIELFGAQLPEFKTQWRHVIKPELKSLATKVQLAVSETFSQVSDTIREAARIPQDRKLTPENIQMTCQYAFQDIFGE